MSLTRSQAKRIVSTALDQASLGDVRVSVTSSRSGNARFGASMPTTGGDIDRLSVAVTAATRDGRKATVTGNRTSREGLAALVKQAEEMAALSPVDPEHMPPRGATSYLSSSGFDRKVATLTAAKRLPMVESAISTGASSGLEMSGFLAHTDTALAAGDRAGLFGYTRNSNLSLGTTARTKDGTGSSKASAASHQLSGVDSGALASRAALWSLRSQNPTALDPGDYTVVLTAQAVADLLGFLLFSMSHRSASEGRSYFSAPGGKTRIGEALFGSNITLRSDPSDATNPATPMTSGGAPQPKVTWIEKGTLRALRASRYWADKNGIVARPMPSSLHLEGGTANLEELIGGVDRGVLVTRFWYNRMLSPRSILVTGLTRDGTFLIEKGKLARPVKNFRYNDSPVTLLKRAVALGVPTRTGSTDRTEVVPPMVVDGFHFESTSDAV